MCTKLMYSSSKFTLYWFLLPCIIVSGSSVMKAKAEVIDTIFLVGLQVLIMKLGHSHYQGKVKHALITLLIKIL